MAPEAAGWARSLASIALLGLLLAGCASPPWFESSVSNSLKPGVGRYRVGPPYEIDGVWYYPAVDYGYDRIGVASWYGEEFEGRLTANGEIFDLNSLTAAHTTLPMPSIVQVTNLENGRSIHLRVNDRGPFADGRLIDVSRRASQLLGFETRGTALVRVTILRDESIAAAEEAMRGSGQILVAQASPAAAPLPISASAYSAAAAAPPMAGSAAPLRAGAAIEARAAPLRRQNAAIPGEPRPALARLAASSRAGRPSSPPVAQPPSPGAPVRTAMASTTPPSTAPMPRPGPPPRTSYRFALISAAEAAELLSIHSPPRQPGYVASSLPVAKLPPSVPKVAARAGESPGRIFVQAGAFARRDNAERVERRITRLGNVRITASSVNGVAIYRVQLGPFENPEQARRLLARVVDSGYPGARIVSD
jgi:rare lipoprotein A